MRLRQGLVLLVYAVLWTLTWAFLLSSCSPVLHGAPAPVPKPTPLPIPLGDYHATWSPNWPKSVVSFRRDGSFREVYSPGMEVWEGEKVWTGEWRYEGGILYLTEQSDHVTYTYRLKLYETGYATGHYTPYRSQPVPNVECTLTLERVK